MAATSPIGLLVSFAAVLAAATAGCGDDAGAPGAVVDEADDEVVVTYAVLGDLVADLVGDEARVRVVVPNGQDPHHHSPSAREVEALRNARFVVANGLDLEEGMLDALDAVAEVGVPVFNVSDHVQVRQVGDGAGDPHVWLDPTTMAEMVPALAAALGDALGVDLGPSATALVDQLVALDAEVREILDPIGVGECRLVTGHESLGYFADRFGCEVIAAVVPSLSSSAEASARDLAVLRELVVREGARAIFTELGTSTDLAEQIAAEADVPLVELATHLLPGDTGYAGFMRRLAGDIAGALTT